MTNSHSYEYAVMQQGREGLHRGPYDNLAQAESWIVEAEADGIPRGVFYIARRVLSPWERIDGFEYAESL